MLDVDSCDTIEAFRSTFRTARKKHKCCACWETISPGHRYWVAEGVCEGVWESWKQCLRCHEIYTILDGKSSFYETPELSLDCGESWEDVFGEPPPLDVAALAFLTPEEAQQRFKGVPTQ